MAYTVIPSPSYTPFADVLPHAHRPTSAAGAVSDGADKACARARRTDPATSHEAAARVAEFSSAHHQRVMDALRRAGGRAGAEQIAHIAGMDAYAARKRLPELQALGAVRATEETAMTRSGRRERVWVVVG